MFSEAAWRELDSREGRFRLAFEGTPDYIPSWYFDAELRQIRPELLV